MNNLFLSALMLSSMPAITHPYTWKDFLMILNEVRTRWKVDTVCRSGCGNTCDAVTLLCLNFWQNHSVVHHPEKQHGSAKFQRNFRGTINMCCSGNKLLNWTQKKWQRSTNVYIFFDATRRIIQLRPSRQQGAGYLTPSPLPDAILNFYKTEHRGS